MARKSAAAGRKRCEFPIRDDWEDDGPAISATGVETSDFDRENKQDQSIQVIKYVYDDGKSQFKKVGKKWQT